MKYRSRLQAHGRLFRRVGKGAGDRSRVEYSWRRRGSHIVRSGHNPGSRHCACKLVAARELGIDAGNAARIAGLVVEDRAVGLGGGRKQFGRIRMRVVAGEPDDPGGRARTQEMRDVELAFARRTPEPTAQGNGILLGEGATHGRRGARVLAQGHYLAAQRRVPDLITPGRRLPDGSGITAIAERLPGLPERR